MKPTSLLSRFQPFAWSSVTLSIRVWLIIDSIQSSDWVDLHTIFDSESFTYQIRNSTSTNIGLQYYTTSNDKLVDNIYEYMIHYDERGQANR